jgi:hypothetical protein
MMTAAIADLLLAVGGRAADDLWMTSRPVCIALLAKPPEA